MTSVGCADPSLQPRVDRLADGGEQPPEPVCTRPGAVTTKTISPREGWRRVRAARRAPRSTAPARRAARRRPRLRLRTVSCEERVLDEIEPGQIRADQVRGRAGDRAGDAELQRVELRRAAEHAGGLRSRRACAPRRRRLLAEGGPARAQRLVDVGRRDLRVEGAAAFEPQRRAIADDDAGVRGRRPGRPPVDDGGAQPGVRGDFPERLHAPLGAARDRRTRQAQQIGDAVDRAAERRALGRRPACPATPATRRVSRPCTPCTSGGCPVAMVVQARAGSRVSPLSEARDAAPSKSAPSAGIRPRLREILGNARIEAVDRDQPRPGRRSTRRRAAALRRARDPLAR